MTDDRQKSANALFVSWFTIHAAQSIALELASLYPRDYIKPDI